MNKNYEIIDKIITETQRYGVLVDTNLLLLFLIGLLDKNLVSSYKRLGNFIEEDFIILDKFLGKYNNIFTTPTILAEVSNLSNSLNGKYKKQFRELLKRFTNSKSQEVYKDIKLYNSSISFIRFGVTDSNITQVAKDGPLILTDDFSLYQYLFSKSFSVLNFNNIRTYGW